MSVTFRSAYRRNHKDTTPAGDSLVHTRVDMQVQGRVLLENATLSLKEGRTYALFGLNGVGKSLLLGAIAGELEESHLVRQFGDAEFPASQTALEYVQAHDVKLRRIEAQIEDALDAVEAGGDTDELESLYTQEEELREAAEERATAALRRVKFRKQRRDTPMQHLSGGWRMRARLAVALNSGARVLLLDEPTSSLDRKGILMLQEIVLELHEELTMVIVSHDRAFLETTCSDVLLFQDKTLRHYAMPFEEFWEVCDQKRKRTGRAFNVQDRKEHQLKKQIAQLQQRAAKGDSSATGALTARKKKLEQLEDGVTNKHECGKRYHRFSTKTFFNPYGPNTNGKLKPPQLAKPPRLSLVGADMSGFRDDEVLLSLNDAVIGIDGKQVARVDINVFRGSRIAILGDQGAGKTLFLRTLAGELPLLGGTRTLNPGVRVAMYSQLAGQHLDASKTPLELLGGNRAALGAVGLGGDLATLPVGALSGGQRARLVFAQCNVVQPHVLMLDEPELHLDLSTIDVLIEGLESFSAALVVVTHDDFVASALTEMQSI